MLLAVPSVDARQVDVLPTQRRDMLQQRIWDVPSRSFELCDRAVEIDGVPVRPYDTGVSHLLIARSADPSFPSDHAAASFAIVFSYVFNARIRKALWFFAAALLLVISRVYVRTHYVGDRYRDRAYCRRAGPDSLSEGTRIDRWVTGIL